jgi:citrate lyase gamma subunit
MVDLGVDRVDVSAVTNDKVYIDAGLNINQPDVLTEIKSLLAALDPQDNTAFFVDGLQPLTKALVLDSSIMSSLVNQSGQLHHVVLDVLEKIGINEIDVLVADSSSPLNPVIDTNQSVAVNLIGQDDELYDFLHNKHH